MASPRMNGVTALVILALVFVTAAYFINDHSQFEDFKARRTAWHQRCDGPREAGRRTDPKAYDACARELDSLMAEGQAHGWVK